MSNGAYLWLTGEHPAATNEKDVVKVPPSRPFTRVPIPPVKRYRDRKNDYQRQPKHKEKC